MSSGSSLSAFKKGSSIPEKANEKAPKNASKASAVVEWASKHTKTLAVATVAMTATSVLLGPSVVHAADGAASALAQQTNSWVKSLVETGFYQAFSLVFLSEIGDKTFFIAGLLAMKTSRFISFLGSMAALGVMTILSVLIGQVFHAVPSGFGEGIPLDDIAAALAFAFFGVKTLMEALQMDENSPSAMDEELADAQETVDSSRTVKEITWVGQLVSIFTLVFAAEFGDRSFLSTIALSAAQNPVSVAGGAIAAHGVATGIAVSGGSVLAKYISERVTLRSRVDVAMTRRFSCSRLDSFSGAVCKAPGEQTRLRECVIRLIKSSTHKQTNRFNRKSKS
eukprot:scaffold528_cov165-Amphora_coffeaeformis.AAC.9